MQHVPIHRNDVVAWSAFNTATTDRSVVVITTQDSIIALNPHVQSQLLYYNIDVRSDRIVTYLALDSIKYIQDVRYSEAAYKGLIAGGAFGLLTGYELAGGFRTSNVRFFTHEYPAINVFSVVLLGDLLLGYGLSQLVGLTYSYDLRL